MQSAKHQVEGVADLVAQSARHFCALFVPGCGHCGAEFLPGVLAQVVHSAGGDGVGAAPFGGHPFGAFHCARSERRKHSHKRLVVSVGERGTALILENGELAVDPACALDRDP